jgi:1,2-phenylacetyl-CoA epoxidase PaaB subunit
VSERVLEPDTELYEVFGRHRVDGRLEHLGTLSAPNMDLARARARLIYSEREWIEMTMAPAAAFERIVGRPDPDSAVGFA